MSRYEVIGAIRMNVRFPDTQTDATLDMLSRTPFKVLAGIWSWFPERVTSNYFNR